MPLRSFTPLSALRLLPLFPSLCCTALPDGLDPPLFLSSLDPFKLNGFRGTTR
ncbi:hypothetical protein FH972_019812 [Carpinus fangiana]|uniref:Uncharacterized protein n=1 Tax=Carpinus fangiana TaxID=176857 RepID=A0A5N6RUT5_9ROSI|nr:hypothetical protein FH972_019812 [Carpinus fangiana]